MDIHEYPRPANDTGIGIHWAPGYAAAIGMARVREFWLPELRALGVKWVKIYNHDGALDFVETLVSEGFMPIVRIYRPTPNPGRLSLRDIVQVDSFLKVGARYFEFNSEPDRDSEWKGGRVPANGQDLVAEDTIVNLEAILERGGMPGIPAVSSGSNWDLVGRIVAKGRKDLFDGPVWLAMHNYAHNRPLDYPYDIGNQEGAAYTDRFFNTVAGEKWDENAWRGRSLAEINRLRMDRAAPGSTIREDHGGWLAFQHFDALNRHHLGRSLPILATEGGYWVGDDADARYPATTPNLHMAQTLEAARMLMGTSTRYAAAPDYLFCVAFSVIANQALGGTSAWWEKFSWYSQRWQGGALPIVRALHAEPKMVRRWQGDSDLRLISLRGAVLNAHGDQQVTLERGGIQVASAPLDANSRYLMSELAPGDYLLRIAGTTVEQQVTLTTDQSDVVVNLDMGSALEAVSRSVVSGRVDGGAGATVILLRQKDGEEFVTMVRDDGAYRFVDLAPGTYSLRVNPEGTLAESLVLDGRNSVEVDLAVAGWGYTVLPADPTQGIGALRVQVRGQRKIPVQVHNVDGSTEPVLTGSNPALGDDICEIGGLDNGLYIVTIGGVTDENAEPIEPEARVTIDRRSVPLVIFAYNEVRAPAQTNGSSIVGRVIGPLEQLSPLRVRLVDARARTSEARVAADGSFRFEALGAGSYAVEVVGHEAIARRQDIALNGVNQVGVDLLLPLQIRQAAIAQSLPGRSAVSGVVLGGAGRLARLVDAVGNEQRQVVGNDEAVRFEELAAGEYTLTIEGGFEQGDLLVDGRNGVVVEFAPLTSSWEVQVTRAESMPGYSVVRVEVEGKQDVPVYIWKEGWEGTMKRSGSNASSPFSLEFSPLGPGVYGIEPDGLNVWTEVELTGLEAVWVTFRPRSTPASPNKVTRTAATPRSAAPTPTPTPESAAPWASPNAPVSQPQTLRPAPLPTPTVAPSIATQVSFQPAPTSTNLAAPSPVSNALPGYSPFSAPAQTPNSGDSRTVDPQTANPHTVDPQTVDPQTVDPEVLPSNGSATNVEPVESPVAPDGRPTTPGGRPTGSESLLPEAYANLPAGERVRPAGFDEIAPKPAEVRDMTGVSHYVWVGEGAADVYDMGELVAWATREGAVAGAQIGEAFQAQVVTIVGDPVVTEPLRVRLAERGILVRNYEEVLAAGHP